MNRKKKVLKLKLKKYIFQILEIMVGTFLMAFSVAFFLLPNQLSEGGFSGIATLSYYLFGWPVGIVVLVLNIPLFIFAYFKKGKQFVARAIIGTVFLSVFIDLLEKLPSFTDDRFLASIYGGILSGIGTSIVLKANASTGGSDLLAYIIRYYNKNIKTSNVIVILDFIIVAINTLFFKKIEVGLYSALSIYIMGKMLDIVFEGIDFTKIIFIISKDYKKISDEISKQLIRGSTGIYAKGMYTNEEKMMLFCVGSRNEVIKISNICNKIDPKSFIVIVNAREVYGKGFKKIK